MSSTEEHLNILYIGQGSIGSTALDRHQALRLAGWHSDFLDITPVLSSASRMQHRLAFRLGIGKLIRDINDMVQKVASRNRPDVIWVDKGNLLTKGTLERLKDINCRLIHFTPDPAVALHATRHFLNCIPIYDLLITTKKWECELYRKAGAKKVIVTNQSTSLSRTKRLTLSADDKKTYETDVVFIGRPEKYYVQCMKTLSQCLKDVRFAVWGDWRRPASHHRWVRKIWRGRAVYGDDYSKALSGAKIGLGFLTKLVPETETTRTFEIPACQTFLLAERTDSHLSLFTEGIEAEYYADLDEAMKKISHYLATPSELNQIASAGHGRFLSAGYSSEETMRRCLAEVKEQIF